MSSQDMPEKGGKGKAPMPWFKMFPEAYLDGTRRLTAEQRGIYSDCLMLLYKHDKPLPKNDAWLACELHVNVKVWRRVRDVLLGLGKLIETPAGYINNRAAIECEERLKRRSNKVGNQLQLGLQIGSKPTATALQTVSDQRLPNDNNDRPPKLRVISGASSSPNEPRHAGAHARASDHQIVEEEKEESLSCADAPLIDDDPHRRRRELSPVVLARLRKKFGDEIVDCALVVYFRSEFAKNARHIDSAFPAWVDSLPKDEQSLKDVMAESYALCRRSDGTLDTTLPTKVSGPQPLRKKDVA